MYHSIPFKDEEEEEEEGREEGVEATVSRYFFLSPTRGSRAGGKGMPVMMTARARLSAKSMPSLT